MRTDGSLRVRTTAESACLVRNANERFIPGFFTFVGDPHELNRHESVQNCSGGIHGAASEQLKCSAQRITIPQKLNLKFTWQ